MIDHNKNQNNMQPLDQTDEPRTSRAYRSLCKQFFVTENHEVIPIADIPQDYHEHYGITLERSEETCTCDDVVKSWSCPFNSCDGQSCTNRMSLLMTFTACLLNVR